MERKQDRGTLGPGACGDASHLQSALMIVIRMQILEHKVRSEALRKFRVGTTNFLKPVMIPV
jgi:hypothetical protein